MGTLKRFTETEKWSDPWFSELSVEHKLFWVHLCDTCDQAGVWNESKKITRAMLGIPEFDFDKALEALGQDRVKVLPSGAWWLIKFISFQNPKGVQEHNNYHAPIFKSAAKHGLDIQDLTKTSPTLDKNASRVQGKYKDEGFELFWAAYPKKKAKGQAWKAWLKNKPDVQAVLASIKATKWSEDEKYIKHPATWLEAQCWLDEDTKTAPVIRRNVL